MRIVTWNVNGLRSALRHGLTAQLDLLKADVVLLQETRVDLSERAGAEAYGALLAANWQVASSPHPREPGRSGTAVLVRRGTHVRIPPRQDEWVYEDEGRAAAVIIEDTFLAMSVYAPNTLKNSRVPYKVEFMRRLAEEVRYLADRAPVVLGGDWNAISDGLDVWDPHLQGEAGARDEEVAALLHLQYNDGVEMVDIWRAHNPTRRQYTWWDYATRARRRNQGWRLDAFLVDEALARTVVQDCTIREDVEGRSDHCPVTLDIN